MINKKLKYSCMIDKIIFNWKCIFWEGKFRKGMEYECLMVCKLYVVYLCFKKIFYVDMI